MACLRVKVMATDIATAIAIPEAMVRASIRTKIKEQKQHLRVGRVETHRRKSKSKSSRKRRRKFLLQRSKRPAGTPEPTRAGRKGPRGVSAARATMSFYWCSDNARSYIIVLLVKTATHTLNATPNYWLVLSGYVKVGQENLYWFPSQDSCTFLMN